LKLAKESRVSKLAGLYSRLVVLCGVRVKEIMIGRNSILKNMVA